MKLHLGFGLAGVGYLIGIGMLACTSHPPLTAALEAAFVRIPLYAGLALCLLLSLSGGAWERPLPARVYWLIGFLGAGCAAVELVSDPACRVVEDFAAGLTGIVGLLVSHRLLVGQRKAART